MVDIYICSKPLQWYNARNIKNSSGNRKILVFIETFKEALSFFEKIIEFDKFWDDYYFVKNRKESVKIIKSHIINNLYVDCDYGRIGLSYGLTKHKKMIVYEEGIGTYFNLLKKSRWPILKKFGLRFIGSGYILGTSVYTNEVIVYNPSFYKKCLTENKVKQKVIVSSFNYVFFKNFRLEQELMYKIFNIPIDFRNYGDMRICLYLVNYEIRDDIVAYLLKNEAYYDLIVLKLHPNKVDCEIKLPSIISSKTSIFKSKGVMAEMLINVLSKNNKLTILNEGSSSCLYIDRTEIEVVDFSNRFGATFESFYMSLIDNKF